MTKTINIETITTFLRTHFKEIQVAYIFGSSKNGFIKENSDIDFPAFKNDIKSWIAKQ